MTTMKASNFKPFTKNTLRGFFTVTLPSGLVIHDCTLHMKDGGARWVGMPARKFEKDGKTGWAPILEFVDRDAADRFRDAVLEAFDAQQASPSPESSPARPSPAPVEQSPRPAAQRSREPLGPPRAEFPKEIDDSDIPF